MTDYPSAISQDIGLTPSVITLKVKVKVKSLSHIRLFATPCNVAYQAPLSMGFSRPEYWSGLPFPSPGDLPNPGKPGSPSFQADALTSEPPVWTVGAPNSFVVQESTVIATNCRLHRAVTNHGGGFYFEVIVCRPCF